MWKQIATCHLDNVVKNIVFVVLLKKKKFKSKGLLLGFKNC